MKAPLNNLTIKFMRNKLTYVMLHSEHLKASEVSSYYYKHYGKDKLGTRI